MTTKRRPIQRPAASEYTIKRLYLADTLRQDRYQISLNGEALAIVDFEKARAAMLGHKHPAELVSE
ncbi:MAG: hypothetical protein D6711_19310 [Chloroflexi bacterium]|nr:MAG: hypothetical protein D6711_19310 [Chloroflexota bacterium]